MIKFKSFEPRGLSLFYMDMTFEEEARIRSRDIIEGITHFLPLLNFLIILVMQRYK